MVLKIQIPSMFRTSTRDDEIVPVQYLFGSSGSPWSDMVLTRLSMVQVKRSQAGAELVVFNRFVG